MHPAEYHYQAGKQVSPAVVQPATKSSCPTDFQVSLSVFDPNPSIPRPPFRPADPSLRPFVSDFAGFEIRERFFGESKKLPRILEILLLLLLIFFLYRTGRRVF